MQSITLPHLEALARGGRLGIGIPSKHGGNGGDLPELFEAVVHTAMSSAAAARVYAVQRHFAEVLLACENVGLAEYRLPYILGGHISGACTATWPEHAGAPLAAPEAGSGCTVHGVLHPVPNVGRHWYLVTGLLRMQAARAPSLVLLSSEQDGMHRSPANFFGNDERDEYAGVAARGVFVRGDEILHEDAWQVVPYLRRFSLFLRCALAAGAAKRVLQHVGGTERLQRHATLTRTIDGLLRDVAGRTRLPDVVDLRTSFALLQHMTAQTRPSLL
jgi:alkylation response protein AidB-like acyl-CoA dehydrogenase